MKDTWEGSRLARAWSSGRIARFGVFEVALDAEELHKNGVKIRVPAQSFRILELLLERPGQVVTRELLRRELWSADTFVDFDRCLNTAVNRLREALGDSAENPRYIQTLPRRGYRFLAPVERADRVVLAADAEVDRPVPDTVPRVTSQRRRRVIWVVAGGFVALAVAAVVLFPWRRPSGPVGPLTIVPLTSFPGTETTPSFSPDGRQIAFSWNGETRDNYDIYVQAVDSGTPRRLTTSRAEDFAPSYSPDGQQIAFYRRSGDYAAVYLISSGGGRPFRFVGVSLGPPGPSSALQGDWSPGLLGWSPDGKFLVFVKKESPVDAFSIWLRSIGTSEERRLTWPPTDSMGDGSPAFSPDGQMLAFVRQKDEFDGDIYLTALTGGRPRRLTMDSRKIRGLSWTSDGRDLIFSSNRAGRPSLWRISGSDGTPERLTGVGENAFFPTISRRGHRLGYVRFASDSNVWRVPLQESSGDDTPERLVAFTQQVGNPRFAPDGKRIVFSSNRSGSREIWICDSQGQNPLPLTSLGSYAASPRWSPEGRHIAFDSLLRGNWDVYVINAEGGEPRRLTMHDGEDVRPSWSSDGRWIYFGSDRSGTEQIWKAPAEGGAAVQVTKSGGLEAVESPDGRCVYYVRRGVSGLWRVPVEGGKEMLILEDLQWTNSRNWVVTGKGIYFLASEGTLSSERRSFVRFFHFNTRRVEQVATLGKARLADTGCSISPDGRWLLYGQQDEAQTDIVVVEDFR